MRERETERETERERDGEEEIGVLITASTKYEKFFLLKESDS